MSNTNQSGYFDAAAENDQVRDDTVRRLVAAVRACGGRWCLDPVVVARRGNVHVVVDGHHRIEAARRLRIGRIPARLGTVGGRDTYLMVSTDAAAVFVPADM